ncbi:MAG: hypothetical protein PVJ57_09185 [Phycisphaerae bacterium]|jgi:hypothetical protein
MHAPISWPLAISRAANSVVVPFGSSRDHVDQLLDEAFVPTA